MLDAVQGVQFGYILCGIIWSIALGFAAGNYACSLVHRLPRGRLILDKTPYCGNCGTLLQVRDLFPVVSALLLKHRCRYCNQPYPTSHTWTELLVGLLFVLAFLKYSFSEQYILVVTMGTFLITLAAIHANEGMVMWRILICVIVPGMLFRTLQDAGLYGFFEGALYAGLLGLLIKRKDIKKVGHIYVPPKLAILMAAGGLCVGLNQLMPFLVLFFLFYAASTLSRRIPITVPFGLALIIPVLYPIG
ncbi:MAG: prepilin peptidase [Rickettsiales bacterium]|nr:prepilin peptidase [Rickettsiales bacterium]